MIRSMLGGLSAVSIIALVFSFCRATAVADCSPATNEVGGDIPLRLPFRPGEHYPVTQGYCQTGWDHTGYQVDFGIPAGTAIVACSAGIVVQLGTYAGTCTDVETLCGLNGLDQGGLFVKVQHPCSEAGQAWYSSYLHLSAQSVTVGQHVEAGETLGLSGNTGLSTGPHLHFHIRKGPADNPLNVPANQVGVRPTPMAGLEMGTGASPILTFTEGFSYQAVEPADAITSVMSPIVSYQYPNDLSSEAVTNGGLVSPIASYQYPNDFGSEALTNGGLVSPIASYQYFEWPGNDVMHLDSSPWVSYYYQFLDAPLLSILPTARMLTMAETTPAVLIPPALQSQLKVYAGGVFTTTPPFPPDRSKMSVVLTHGWNSSPEAWARNMATLIAGSVATVPNIFAWDWTSASKSTPCVSWQMDFVAAARGTSDQGAMLGGALQTMLGADYSQRIHFIGHSLGTLVNAYAADYVHKRGFDWANTQMTLFDEAEVATDLSCPEVISAVLFNQWNPLAPKPYYYHPLPKQFAWADSYISAFGILHPEAANVILTNGFPANAANVKDFVAKVSAFHGYPPDWYAETITTDVSAMGYRWSFERGGVAGAPAANKVFLQSFNGSFWNLVETDYPSGNSFLDARFQRYRDALAYAITRRAPESVDAKGGVTGEMLATGPANAFDLILLHLLTRSGGGTKSPQAGGAKDDTGGGGTNETACAWIRLPIPVDAISMTFDFKIEGDWAGDSLAAALNGTNVLLVAASEIETNVVLNSGPIDVMAYAGQTNEFFVGIVGGTSTNAQLTVENLAFYVSGAPSLTAQGSGGGVRVTWPLTAQSFGLQSTTNLGDAGAWVTMTNAAGIVDLQNAVTNPTSGDREFYRLKK